MPTASSVDEYIAAFPPAIRKRLAAVRAIVRRAAPAAEEGISYRIASYKLDGALVYFAGFDGHIGMYPITAATREKLGKALATYTPPKSKGTARFPHDQPLPVTLIARIVTERAKENKARVAARTKKR